MPTPVLTPNPAPVLEAFPRIASDLMILPDSAGYEDKKRLSEAFPKYEPNYILSSTARIDSHLDRINAAAAYARGATGAGETIAMTLSGAFGVSLQHQLADMEVAGFDALGAKLGTARSSIW